MKVKTNTTMKNQISIAGLSRGAILVTFIIALMYLAKSIFIPLAFAMFFSFLLYPVCKFFERKLPTVVAILLTFLSVILILAGIGYFFGTQFYSLFENIKDFGANIRQSFDKIVSLLENSLLKGNIKLDNLVNSDSENLVNPMDVIQGTISTSTGFLVGLGLIFIYTFLFLLYRGSFKKFILFHFKERENENVKDVLTTIQKVAQNYFFGVIIVILIVGTLNGLGLWIMGLDYPFLFGYFAALLAIIPYIGTFIGGMLPALYALVNEQNGWLAFFVVLWYIGIQTLEGNILTPKIVGSRVSLNPLIALIALLIGGLIWGIAGMVLFIPFMAILKVIFDSIEPLKPYGMLLSSDFGSKEFTIVRKVEKKEEKEEVKEVLTKE